jgi:hypothetical protein
MWKVQVEEMMIDIFSNTDFQFNLVIDGSFCQPLESTRLTRTSNVRYKEYDYVFLFDMYCFSGHQMIQQYVLRKIFHVLRNVRKRTFDLVFLR